MWDYDEFDSKLIFSWLTPKDSNQELIVIDKYEIYVNEVEVDIVTGNKYELRNYSNPVS